MGYECTKITNQGMILVAMAMNGKTDGEPSRAWFPSGNRPWANS